MMVTSYDDEDIERSAAALRSRFRFSVDRGNLKIPGTSTLKEHNAAVAKFMREENIRLSREAAKLHFESMGAQYIPKVLAA